MTKKDPILDVHKLVSIIIITEIITKITKKITNLILFKKKKIIVIHKVMKTQHLNLEFGHTKKLAKRYKTQ
jgi:hypothetical protein